MPRKPKKRGPGRPPSLVPSVPTTIKLPVPVKNSLISEALQCKVKLATIIQATLRIARPDLPWEPDGPGAREIPAGPDPE